MSEEAINYENSKANMKDYLIKLIGNITKKLDKPKLIDLANVLEISINTKNKKTLKTEIEDKIRLLSNEKIIEAIRTSNVGIRFEVKNLNNKISIDYLIESNICLPLKKFLEANNSLKEKFNKTCDLTNKNDSVTSNNCARDEVQGLYILTISKNGIDYIVKLGSYAESQGMSKRITSFGGGNYATGSATNKWFQTFIKKALKEGYTSKFTYYNRFEPKIKIKNLDDEEKEIVPYVTRGLESELFEKYNSTNNNIPPIFGSNCL